MDAHSLIQQYRRPPPLLIVLSGPSGVGKDVTLARLRAARPSCHFVVTATTRPRRLSERDGVDYIFMSPAQFQETLARDGFLEHAQVYGHSYGVPRQQVRDALGQGRDVVVKIDVQGAATIKRLAPQGVFIFLAPPSMEALAHRLRARKTESAADLEVRLATARAEMQRVSMFDYVVVNENDSLDSTMAQIDAIITAEKRRVVPRRVEL